MLARTLIFIFSIILFPVLQAEEIRKASDVFKKWTTWQKIIAEYVPSENDQISSRARVVKEFYENNLTHLRHATPFLEKFSHGTINQYGYQIKEKLSEFFENNMTQCIHDAYTDITLFLKTLKKYNLGLHEKIAISDQIAFYNALIGLIFAHEDKDLEESRLFTLANRFFEFCFSSSANSLQQMFLTHNDQLYIRMMYAVMWEKLAGNGWKHWNKKSLEQLKQEYDNGKNIVYLAGGSDIYQLVTHGIHSLHIIDPQLPTQPKYYADQWDWLIRNNASHNGGLGDCIIFEEQNFFLKRSFFQETGSPFVMRLSNGTYIQIIQSITQWNVINNENQVIGCIIFERRPISQKDFTNNPDCTLLMSFNELYFIALPKHLGGWGIDVAQFPSTLTIIGKQLSHPISRATLCTLHTANLLNASDLKFIDLGTCVN